jgi:hypothetical protein
MVSTAWIASFTSFGAVAAVAGGCAPDAGGPDWPPPVHEALRQQTTMPLMPDSCSAHLDGRSLPLQGGDITLMIARDGRVELDGVRVELQDIRVTGEDPRLDGLVLTDVRVTLSQPAVAPVEWTVHGDAGYATLVVDLDLDWTLVTPQGHLATLATQHLQDVTVDLDLFTGPDGRVIAVLHGGKLGVVWSWAGLVELRDLYFDVRAELPSDGADDVGSR